MTRPDGQSFAYLGGDVDGGGFLFPPGTFSVTGLTTGGGFATDPIGTGDWLDLVAVRFAAGSNGGPGGTPEVLFLTADNLTVRVVPIPAAVWLFGSALGLLGWLRRR